MITKTIKSGETLIFYSSIKEMPIKLYNLTQRYLLQDMGIGSDMPAIDDHFKALDGFLSANKIQEAISERENQRFAFYTMLQEVNYKSLAFGCHVFSINGRLIEDRSEESLSEMLSGLGITIEDVDEVLLDLKKNFNMN